MRGFWANSKVARCFYLKPQKRGSNCLIGLRIKCSANMFARINESEPTDRATYVGGRLFCILFLSFVLKVCSYPYGDNSTDIADNIPILQLHFLFNVFQTDQNSVYITKRFVHNRNNIIHWICRNFELRHITIHREVSSVSEKCSSSLSRALSSSSFMSSISFLHFRE